MKRIQQREVLVNEPLNLWQSVQSSSTTALNNKREITLKLRLTDLSTINIQNTEKQWNVLAYTSTTARYTSFSSSVARMPWVITPKNNRIRTTDILWLVKPQCVLCKYVFFLTTCHTPVTSQNILGFGNLPYGTTSYLELLNTRMNDQLCPDTPYQLFSCDIKMHNVYLELSLAFLRWFFDVIFYWYLHVLFLANTVNLSCKCISCKKGIQHSKNFKILINRFVFEIISI